MELSNIYRMMIDGKDLICILNSWNVLKNFFNDNWIELHLISGIFCLSKNQKKIDNVKIFNFKNITKIFE